MLFGLISKNFVTDLKNESTFNEAAFGREYESIWTGSVEDAFFNGDNFNRNRILQKPEYEHSGHSNKNAFYVASVDVGRKGCQTVISIFKVTPQSQGTVIVSLVNMYTLEDEHFEDQAIFIKSLFYKYKCKRVVIDGNGLGIGLLDYMVKKQVLDNGDIYPDFGVYNDPDGFYKKFLTDITEQNAIYVIKANAPINTRAYSVCQSWLDSGKIKLLIDEKIAKQKLMNTKMGQQMTPEQRAEYLKPFTLTSILREEILNLRQENEGTNIILKQVNRGIPKDKFSSFVYGLYYIAEEEVDNVKRRKKFKASDWLFLN